MSASFRLGQAFAILVYFILIASPQTALCGDGAQACCMSDGSCQMATAEACVELDGVPAGAGTECTIVGDRDFICGNAWACCTADGSSSTPFCSNHWPHFCVKQRGGTPLGPVNVCKAMASDDGDAVGDLCDNCPMTANPTQGDCDADGIGDECETNSAEMDGDGDGVCDGLDNCATTSNQNQLDSDGDDVGDACDLCPGGDDDVDTDGDALADHCDPCPTEPGVTCPSPVIPTASTWGLLALALALLILAKNRRSSLAH